MKQDPVHPDTWLVLKTEVKNWIKLQKKIIKEFLECLYKEGKKESELYQKIKNLLDQEFINFEEKNIENQNGTSSQKIGHGGDGEEFLNNY